MSTTNSGPTRRPRNRKALNLAAAMDDGVVVAFEADAVDAVTHSGWSVVVTGHATVVDDPDEHNHLTRTGPRSWVASPHDVFIRIASELVTGRELVDGRTMPVVQPPPETR